MRASAFKSSGAARNSASALTAFSRALLSARDKEFSDGCFGRLRAGSHQAAGGPAQAWTTMVITWASEPGLRRGTTMLSLAMETPIYLVRAHDRRHVAWTSLVVRSEGLQTRRRLSTWYARAY